jgi:hypothetical protein
MALAMPGQRRQESCSRVYVWASLCMVEISQENTRLMYLSDEGSLIEFEQATVFEPAS